MRDIIPNTSEGAGEKHLPVVTMNGNTMQVNISSVNHPMTSEHFIEWIYVETENGCLKKHLNFNDEPRASFNLNNQKTIRVYAYCNLHGLWMTEIK